MKRINLTGDFVKEIENQFRNNIGGEAVDLATLEVGSDQWLICGLVIMLHRISGVDLFKDVRDCSTHENN